MTGIDELVERSGSLKQEVLSFAQRRRFDRELAQEVRHRLGDPDEADESELDNFFDWFIQQYRRPDGRTIVACFLETRHLPDAEREFLLGWRDVVEGFFEVTGKDGPELVTVNVIDDLEYRIRANVGPSVFDRFPVGSFLIARVVPLGGSWLISGWLQGYGPDSRETVLRAAAETALESPALTFRNPDRLARAWEIQRAERAAFIEHFGSDTVLLHRSKVPERLREYAIQRSLGEDWAAGISDPLHPGTETLGLIYDEEDGLGVYGDFLLAEEAFADPELVRTQPHRRVLTNYLTVESTSPVPLVRLAERDPDKADQVFRRLLGKPRFGWKTDGEALLREHKPAWYERPPLPRTVVIGDRLLPYLRAASR